MLLLASGLFLVHLSHYWLLSFIFVLKGFDLTLMIFQLLTFSHFFFLAALLCSFGKFHLIVAQYQLFPCRFTREGYLDDLQLLA
jgi:hypothetical protein